MQRRRDVPFAVYAFFAVYAVYAVYAVCAISRGRQHGALSTQRVHTHIMYDHPHRLDSQDPQRHRGPTNPSGGTPRFGGSNVLARRRLVQLHIPGPVRG